jgi:hypothetical protein
MMGMMDFLQNNNPFLKSRDGDFIPLEKSEEDVLGPPVLILYAVPKSMDDDEFIDMVCDGMPGRRVVETVTSSSSYWGDGENVIVLRRLEGMNEKGEGGDEVLDLSVKDALDRLASSSTATASASTIISSSSFAALEKDELCPVLYFSGVTNSEMMNTYRIIANEIYEESNGVHWPACAKAVAPAFTKSLRRVLSEISGDHAEAMKLQRGAEEGESEV